MADKQNGEVPAPRWNRQEVNRYLLPVLRYADSLRQGEDDERLAEHAAVSMATYPQAYAQLSRVWRTGSTEVLDKWFGQFACDDALIDEAFDIIDRDGGEHARGQTAFSYEKQMYFAGLFRISEEGRTVDLTQPFEQYYFCDEVIYRDYLYRRVRLGDECTAWIRRYLPYYNRIRAWYRENGEARSGVGYEYVAYMELYDHFRERMMYADRLKEERQALEYERGGLGWFHRARKREIGDELHALDLRELTMQLEDATERYEAYEAQFLPEREVWLNELECAPLTAFGRKKELRQKLSELEEKLRAYRAELKLDELHEKHRKMLKSKGK